MSTAGVAFRSRSAVRAALDVDRGQAVSAQVIEPHVPILRPRSLGRSLRSIATPPSDLLEILRKAIVRHNGKYALWSCSLFLAVQPGGCEGAHYLRARCHTISLVPWAYAVFVGFNMKANGAAQDWPTPHSFGPSPRISGRKSAYRANDRISYKISKWLLSIEFYVPR